MRLFPLESKTNLLCSQTLDGAVLLRHLIALRSAPEGCWPKRLGYVSFKCCEIRSAVSTVLRRQDLGGVDEDWRSIVDRAICSEPLARLYGD